MYNYIGICIRLKANCNKDNTILLLFIGLLIISMFFFSA